MKKFFVTWLAVILTAFFVSVGICYADPVVNPWTNGNYKADTKVTAQTARIDSLYLFSGGTVYGANPFVFEGATFDNYQTTLSITDPTADRTIALPNASGTVALTPFNAYEFEGTTVDDFETTVTATDPTADRTITLPDASGAVVLSTLATNAPDAANSVTGASNALVFEGATANAFETSITPTDPTTDNTLTLPDYTGAVPIIVQQGYTQFSHSEATTVDVTGAVLTLADGWFTEGKTFRVRAGGTVTGANDAITVALYLEDGAVCSLTTGSAAAGDWTAEFTIIATGAETQRIIGTLVAGGGTDPVSDYAADTTDTASAGTIPLKLQVGLASADDVITCEYWSIEHWSLAD